MRYTLPAALAGLVAIALSPLASAGVGKRAAREDYGTEIKFTLAEVLEAVPANTSHPLYARQSGRTNVLDDGPPLSAAQLAAIAADENRISLGSGLGLTGTVSCVHTIKVTFASYYYRPRKADGTLTTPTRANGYLTNAQFQAEVDAMNANFARYHKTPVKFVMQTPIRRYATSLSVWQGLVAETPTTADATAYKKTFSLATDIRPTPRSTKDLFIYSVYETPKDPAPDIVGGWGTFPWYLKNGQDGKTSAAQQKLIDGIWVPHYRLTGGSIYQKELLTHEGGHWLGLLHTFEGGCTLGGDSVSDTAPWTKGSGNFDTAAYKGCAASTAYPASLGDYLDPCPATSKTKRTQNVLEAAVQNYMSYSPGDCTKRFTAGQYTKIRKALAANRGFKASTCK